MLVLTRKTGQTVRIGDDVTVRILEVRDSATGRSQVRLGIDAPPDVPVNREEVLVRQREREGA